jgi:competence protein ComGF
MDFKIVEPKISTPGSAILFALKSSKIFLSLVFINIAVAVFYIENLPIFLFFLLFSIPFIAFNANGLFWKDLADVNGWKYEPVGDLTQEKGIMFKQGHSNVISSIVSVNINNKQFSIFSYSFKIGHGKHSKQYNFTVFCFSFNGSFPHIYLNNKDNFYDVTFEGKIPLPLEFEKKFSLYSPDGYEIEALQIFTEDIMVKLLDAKFNHDIEFVDKELLIFVDGNIWNFETLEKEIQNALTLEDMFDEKLNNFKFEKIGDKSPYLKD